MEIKAYKRIKGLVMMLMMGVVGWGVWEESVLVVVVGLTVGMMGVTWLKTRVKGVLVDERVEDIGEKAARTAFTILMPVLGLASLALVVGGDKEEFYYVKALGIVLSYVTCLGLMIYVLSYWYFERKFGGK